ncbi:ABC-2 type transport system permease protein [Clostridium sp. USBA 49]|uniref:ABC transporter permease n=1 Tax=Clostridium sp. USBA 49 TaxID=1881060 RepID=UPI00099A0C88|nr:ABC transporter permease [Clostridium sp. USBA 49]SKA92375.1 ABC-2 type transport system permease protein [Clostridium sp. USBA 49]
MAGFNTALINEIEKLYKKNKLLVAVIISIIFIIIGQAGILGLRSGFGLRGASNMNFPILVLSAIVNTILPLFTALITIDSFSGEFSQNTMKIALTRPITRFKFFTAKLTSIIIYILFNLYFIMIVSMLTGFIFNSNSFTLRGFINIIISYTVSLIPMIILALVIIILTNLIKNGTGVFFTSIFIFIIFKIIEIVFSKYSGILFTSMLDWYKLWIINPMPIFKIIRKFMLMLSYGIIFFTLGYYLFDKKDF